MGYGTGVGWGPGGGFGVVGTGGVGTSQPIGGMRDVPAAGSLPPGTPAGWTVYQDPYGNLVAFQPSIGGAPSITLTGSGVRITGNAGPPPGLTLVGITGENGQIMPMGNTLTSVGGGGGGGGGASVDTRAGLLNLINGTTDWTPANYTAYQNAIQDAFNRGLIEDADQTYLLYLIEYHYNVANNIAPPAPPGGTATPPGTTTPIGTTPPIGGTNPPVTGGNMPNLPSQQDYGTIFRNRFGLNAPVRNPWEMWLSNQSDLYENVYKNLGKFTPVMQGADPATPNAPMFSDWLGGMGTAPTGGLYSQGSYLWDRLRNMTSAQRGDAWNFQPTVNNFGQVVQPGGGDNSVNPSMNDLATMIETGLRDRYGGWGTRWLAGNLPREQEQYLGQRTPETPGGTTFLDWLISKYNL